MGDGDLQALGVLLRQTREAHALSLEEVEVQTRIRVKFLRALESGDISVLPSAAHAKGFLRNYAQFLRLDVDAVVTQFVEATGSVPSTVMPSSVPPKRSAPLTPPSIPAFEEPSSESASAPAARSTVRSTGETGPLRVAPNQRVGPSIPLGVSREGASDAGPRPPRSSSGRFLKSNLLVGAVLVIGMITIVGWAITQLSTITGDELVPTEQALGEFEGSVTSTVVEVELAAQPTSTPSPTAGIPILDRVLLTITVTQRTWVRIIVDDEVVFEGQAEPGNLLQYTGQQSIVVIAGNGAGLDVTYNGQAIGSLGGRGEAVQRIFTPTGQSTPTPTLTVTPTSTSVPSPTPRANQTPTRQP